MSIVSHLHHLFNPETCQSYIHMLRWKDRPLQCPRCQSHNVGPWGTYHYQPGLQCYRCKEQACKRTFNDLTGTLLDGSKRSVMHWMLATFLLCLSCSSRRIARELGVHVRTGYRWCWWLRNAALSYEIGRQLDGTVEADDLSHTAGHKGQATQGGTKASRCFSQTERLHDLGIGLCMHRDACGLQIAVESPPVKPLPQRLPCPGPSR